MAAAASGGRPGPKSGSGASHSRFWKPGTLAPGVDIQRSATPAEEALDGLVVYNPHAHLSVPEQRQVLPIHGVRRELLWALERHRVLILVGATGSGKTTQLPQYLYEAGWTAGGRAVCVCQPRQVAAVSVADRVAEELGGVDRGGRIVGCRLRLSSQPGQQAEEPKQLVFTTDAALACETMDDPLLSRYSVVVLDEAHERSLQTDLLLGLCRKILWQRADLRLVISSATLEAERFREFFARRPKRLASQRPEGGNASSASNQPGAGGALPVHILRIPQRQYPVAVRYLKEPVADYVQATVEAVRFIHRNHLRGNGKSSALSSRGPSGVPPGDILCFLSCPEEIEAACGMLEQMAEAGQLPGLAVYPLHAKLAPPDQLAALRPLSQADRRAGHRWKCIVSTNLAETSLTIPGVSYVVDAGWTKLVSYDPRTAVSTLQTTPVSRQSAVQRAGRAGRQTPGLCYRLYTEEAFLRELPERTVPEICRTQLAGLVLQLKALGVDDIVGFEFCQPPPRELLADALELCFALGCLDDQGRLTTPVGRTVAEFMGLSGIAETPHLAKLLYTAGQPEFHCSDEISTIAAALTVKTVWASPRTQVGQARADACRLAYAVEQGDHLTLLNVVNAFIAAGQDQEWCGARYLSFKALRRAVEVRRTLRGYMRRLGIPVLAHERPEQIQRCLAAAYFMNAAQQTPDGQTWATPRGQRGLRLHPSSVLVGMTPASVSSWTSQATSVTLKAPWVVYHELIHTSGTWIRDCTVVQPEWLLELAPNYFDYRPSSSASSASSASPPSSSPSSSASPSSTSAPVAIGPSKHPSASASAYPSGGPSAPSVPADLPEELGAAVPNPGQIVFRPRKHRRIF